MNIQEITGDGYQVQYNPDTNEIFLKGDLALKGPSEYAPIKALLLSVLEQSPETITLNLKELSFLNSSGISMISKFVLSLKSQKETQLIVVGSDSIPWQKKSLRNLQKFLPSLELRL